MRFLSAALLCVTFSACNSVDPAVEEAWSSRERLEVEEASQAYKAFVDENKRPPKASNDLKKYDGGYTLGVQAIQQGSCVVRWGTPWAETNDSATVLVYEKQAPTNGGWTAFSDGAVKKLTADELNAALKSAG
jgi:hypothetical protein